MKQLRVMTAIDTKDPIKLGKGLADGVFGAIRQVHANRPLHEAEAKALGACMSSLAGHAAREYGEVAVVNFCLETITALHKAKVAATDDQLANQLSRPFAFADSIVHQLVTSMDEAYAAGSSEGSACLNYTLSALAAVLGARYGYDTLISFCETTTKLAQGEIANSPIQ